MAKVLLLIIFGAVVYKMFRSYKNMLTERDAPKDPKLEDMVRCARCGVYVPRSESFLSQEKYYCSEEHLNVDSGVDRS